MSRVLLTGFEPFRRWRINSSWEAVRLVAARRPGLAAVRLPVDHDAAAEAVAGLIRRERPEVVLLTGLASGSAFRLETMARPGPLAPAGGPVVRRGCWPFAASLAALGALGIPARISRDAGRFVCDTTYWAALGEQGPARCLFLHVPPLGPGWSARRIARGVEAVLEAGLSDPAGG